MVDSVQGVYYIRAKDSDGKMKVRAPPRLYGGGVSRPWFADAA